MVFVAPFYHWNKKPIVVIKTHSTASKDKSPYFGDNYAFRFHSREEYERLIQNVGLEIFWLETLGRTYSSGNKYFEFLVFEAHLTS